MSYSFADINKESEIYTYSYLFTLKSFLRKKFYVISFKSKLPHYVFTDILYILKMKLHNENKYIEDIIEAKIEIDLQIGLLSFSEFTESDLKKYSKKKENWQKYLDSALDKQEEFEKEYEEKHGGHPDLNLPKRSLVF